MKRNIAPLLFGVVFILAGLGYVGGVLFDWNFTIFFDGWWTLFLIVPAFISILSNGPKAANFAILLIGGLLLLHAQGVIPDGKFGMIIGASVVLFIGIALVVRFIRGPKQQTIPPQSTYTYSTNNPMGGTTTINVDPSGVNYQTDSSNHTSANTTYTANTSSNKNYASDTTSQPNYNAILSGVDARNTSTDFQGAKIAAILGGVDLDLRDAVVTHDITIYATAVMGGIDIFAPQNVRIIIEKTDILGGTSCKAFSAPPDANVPIVTFNCTTVMGGIEIK